MKPVLLGMNNPYSERLADVLHPSKFPNSAGSRLYQMVRSVDDSISEADYLQHLDRRNLVTAGDWTKAAAKDAAVGLRSRLSGRKVVMLGMMLPSCLGIKHAPTWYEWRQVVFVDVDEPVQYCVIPHPSGLSRIYNDVEFQYHTGRLIAGLISEERLP